MSVAPAKIASLDRHGNWIKPGIPANLVVVDWHEQWTPELFLSKSSNSLFAGVPLTGRVRFTFRDGGLTYDSARLDMPVPSRGSGAFR